MNTEVSPLATDCLFRQYIRVQPRHSASRTRSDYGICAAACAVAYSPRHPQRCRDHYSHGGLYIEIVRLPTVVVQQKKTDRTMTDTCKMLYCSTSPSRTIAKKNEVGIRNSPLTPSLQHLVIFLKPPRRTARPQWPRYTMISTSRQ